MVRTYQDVFGSVYIVATKHGPNEIVLAMPANAPVVRASLARRASQLSKDYRLAAQLAYSWIRTRSHHLQNKNTVSCGGPGVPEGAMLT
jgi:hypothetical protein